jgi:hypothetical protein
VLVGGLVVVLVMGIVQLALGLHVHATLVDCAGEGARYAAAAGRTPEDGARRTAELAAAALAPPYASDVTAGLIDVDGVPMVEVTVRAPIPVIGLLGPGGTMTVRGHALAEQP